MSGSSNWAFVALTAVSSVPVRLWRKRETADLDSSGLCVYVGRVCVCVRVLRGVNSLVRSQC